MSGGAGVAYAGGTAPGSSSGSDIKILIAYFSCSGTTRNIADAISQKTGGDLFGITPQDGYCLGAFFNDRDFRRLSFLVFG